jgi:hypothetical protein
MVDSRLTHSKFPPAYLENDFAGSTGLNTLSPVDVKDIATPPQPARAPWFSDIAGGYSALLGQNPISEQKSHITGVLRVFPIFCRPFTLGLPMQLTAFWPTKGNPIPLLPGLKTTFDDRVPLINADQMAEMAGKVHQGLYGDNSNPSDLHGTYGVTPSVLGQIMQVGSQYNLISREKTSDAIMAGIPEGCR